MQKLGLAIRWSDDPGCIGRIRKLGGVPISGRPQHVAPRGTTVAIVQAEGRVRYLFTSKKFEGPTEVRLADGKIASNGYLVKAQPGTIHEPAEGEVAEFRIRWRAVGQFRYFDPDSGRAALVSDTRGDSNYLQDGSPHPGPSPARPYGGGIPGKGRHHPEALLVDAYVAWMNTPDRFAHVYLRSARLHTDLFDRSRWRVIEAKAVLDRRTLRVAVGQLLDYRRFFNRKPSVGVLLPHRPTREDLKFLNDCRVVAVWRTPQGRFSDSTPDRRWSRRK